VLTAVQWWLLQHKASPRRHPFTLPSFIWRRRCARRPSFIIQRQLRSPLPKPFCCYRLLKTAHMGQMTGDHQYTRALLRGMHSWFSPDAKLMPFRIASDIHASDLSDSDRVDHARLAMGCRFSELGRLLAGGRAGSDRFASPVQLAQRLESHLSVSASSLVYFFC
jgi:hypothetical protein